MESEFVIRHLARVGTVRSRLPNGRVLRLRSLGDDWISNQVYWRGWQGFEPETAPVIYRLATRARVVFDIGAHVGFVSLLAAHANPDGEVHAFEPFPAAFARLEGNVALNRVANVTCNACAAGETDEACELFHGDSEIPSSTSLSYEFMSDIVKGDLRSLTVPVVTLDRYVRERGIPRVDLVKVDTESTEPQVLRGMRETLERDHPSIICEVLQGRGTDRPLADVLGPLGYHFYHLTPRGPVLSERIESHPEWPNYLFSALGPGEISDIFAVNNC